jgi:hypothetical protein
MKTFIIFDRETGEILQTHMQPDDLHNGPEDLLKVVRPEGESEDVGVMEVEGLEPGTSYQVDIKGKKLMPVDRNETRGTGGAFVQSVDGDPLRAKTVVFHLESKK